MPTSTSLRISSLVAASAMSLAAHAQAVAYSNLAPAPNLYSDGAGFGASSQGVAARFVSTKTGNLSRFLGAIHNSLLAGPGDPIALSLHADGPGMSRGALLASYSGVATGAWTFDGSYPLASVETPGGPLIQAGAAYWVHLSSTAVPGVSWSVSYSGGRVQFDSLPAEDFVLPAFAVEVEPVPEPASLAALGLGTLALARRCKNAAR